MEKNFDKWNKVKKIRDKVDIGFYYYSGEIWWAEIGINIGAEENSALALLTQLKTFSSKRLIRKITKISDAQLLELKEKLKGLI